MAHGTQKHVPHSLTHTHAHTHTPRCPGCSVLLECLAFKSTQNRGTLDMMTEVCGNVGVGARVYARSRAIPACVSN